MSAEQNYRILLYYKYVPIADFEQFAKDHLQYCKELGVKGRILIASEGINGTISGTVEQTNEYMRYMHSQLLFKDMSFKIDPSAGHAFHKIFVRQKKELVTFRLEEDVDPNVLTGKHLTPKEFYDKMQDEDVIVLDGRNYYEYDVGHFRNAIRPEIESFRDFPDWIRENLSEYKDRPILTYCTGGIRCEKLSGFLLKEGFKNVAQLEGGIVTYGKDEEIKGRLFDGKCYVFDERKTVPINQTDEDIIVGKCHHCGRSEDRFINCANDYCHLQHISCITCEEEHKSFCSDACEQFELSRYEG
jgi:UPF0176 protein